MFQNRGNDVWRKESLYLSWQEPAAQGKQPLPGSLGDYCPIVKSSTWTPFIRLSWKADSSPPSVGRGRIGGFSTLREHMCYNEATNLWKEACGVLVHKAYKYRIYPSKEQQKLIHQMFGCCRFVFNHFLGLWNDTYAATGKGLSYTPVPRSFLLWNSSLNGWNP